MMSLCPDTVNMNEFDTSAWYAQSALKATKETGDAGVAMILDHFRRVLGK
jgi:creatinine amidohydrolase/Fe(II)-dependent formamide hydrolase-like protein